MTRKIVSCILIASLSLSIGCYSNQTITKEELKTRAELDDITVYTKESLSYDFPKENYRIQGDTLSGFLVQRSATTGIFESFVVSIAFADITSIEVEKFSVLKTIILCGVVGLVIVLIIGSTAIKGQSSGGLRLPDFGH